MFNKFHANHPGFSKPFVFLRRSWPLSCSVQIFCWIKIGLYRFCSELLHFIMWNGDKKRLVWLDRGACITRGKVPVFFCERKLLKCRTTLDIFLKRCVVVSCLLNLAFFFYLLQIHFVPVYTSLNHQQPAWKTALKLPCDEQTHITLALKKTKNLQLQRKIRLIQLTFFKIHFAIELLFMKTQKPSWLADDFHLASELAYLWNQGYILYLL